jgi:DNA-binding PadR family transcriptional regulator
MPPKNHRAFDSSHHLAPLTPAVFFVLFALAEGEKHGYAIMQVVATLSDNKVRMGPGTLYTTIQRLLNLALIEEVVVSDVTDHDGRRRYYRLTRSGKTLLDAEVDRMESVVRRARRSTATLRTSE